MNKVTERLEKYAEKQARKEEQRSKARKLLDAGYSRKEVAEFMGVAESTIRAWTE